MAKTIAQGFQILCGNTNISGLQEETASTRQKNVREAVEKELDVLDSFLTGSYRRNTMLAPLSGADIDVFVVLDPKYYQSDGQAALLDKVKATLKKTYPKTPKISRNGQAVTITFTDFKVDVVPGFYREGGGYLIPDSARGEWIATDPKKHVDIWAAANKAHNGDLVPLLKIIKAWNKSHDDVMRSFHLETVALLVLDNVRIDNLWSGARFVFDKARAKISVKVPDPAEYSDDVAAHIRTQADIDKVVSALQVAYDRALAAEALERAGKTSQAFEKWALVFGDYFPAYG